MAHDDRDLNFEKALARHLRSSAASGVEANALAGSPLETCPDPEILAAYHEQSLSFADLSIWKEHVVACDRCHYVLVQLAETEKITLQASTPEDALLVEERTLFPKKRDHNSGFVNGVRRPPSWRWVLLIPAGAMAASLVAWVSLRNSVPVSIPPSSSVQTAENQPAPPVPASSKPALAGPSENAINEKEQATGSIAGAVSRNRDSAATQLHEQAQLTQQVPNQRVANTPHGPSVSLQKQQQQQVSQIVAGAPVAPIQNELEPKATPGATHGGGEALAQPAAPPPPPPASPQSSFIADGAVNAPLAKKAAPSAPAPAANPSAPKAKSAVGGVMSAPSEAEEVSAEPLSRSHASAVMRAAVLQNPHVFGAPDGNHLWRLGPAGSLEYSADKGEKWNPQFSGVTTDLLAGSAASPRVAWIVGRSGTILRTTDGGVHWTKLDSPVTHDLVGVSAIDAFHATISFVADPQSGAVKSYVTSDGGETWSPIPPE